MRSKPANSIAAAFLNSVTRLDATRKRIEQAYSNGGLKSVDVDVAYTGLFLQAVVCYESSVEEFVLGLVVRPGGIASATIGVRGRVKVRSYAHAMQLASGPKNRYPAWLKKEDLKAIAGLLLHRSAPFEAVAPQVNWQYVEQIHYIRNAIAHPSEHARNQFAKHVIGSTPLLRRERSVAGYLRGKGAGLQTRWEIFVAALVQFVQSTIN